MTNQGWAFNWRSDAALAALFVVGLPLFQVFQAAPAQANPATRSSTVAVTVPALPPLGEPEPFLPTPNERAIQLVIRLSERRVYVYDREQVITSYPIAIGRSGWETPTGEFEVIQMLSNPTWEHPFTGELVPPGAGNPLGSRWIGFWTDGTNYIGFHGTPDAETVGQAASHGCIRMYDQDVQALFEIVQMGTPVVVRP
jgi:lipoprotein-anchoring transpeptidase ErfK/SrfK